MADIGWCWLGGLQTNPVRQQRRAHVIIDTHQIQILHGGARREGGDFQLRTPAPAEFG